MPLQEWSETTLIAQMTDEPLFSEDIEQLDRHLDGAGDAMPDVIVDLKSVAALNSSNLAQLLKLRTRLRAANRRLRICAAGSHVWSVFEITGLSKFFEFTDDVSTSLASLQIAGGSDAVTE